MIRVKMIVPPSLHVAVQSASQILHVGLVQATPLQVKVAVITYATSSDIDIYDGSYAVTPKVEDQSMQTARKYMTEDVHIREIPFYAVSNLQNGKTIVIGVDEYGNE